MSWSVCYSSENIHHTKRLRVLPTQTFLVVSCVKITDEISHCKFLPLDLEIKRNGGNCEFAELSFTAARFCRSTHTKVCAQYPLRKRRKKYHPWLISLQRNGDISSLWNSIPFQHNFCKNAFQKYLVFRQWLLLRVFVLQQVSL